ncbi:hypothetical protein [Persicobacter psychrovividus]|uniref:Uncharacterized protein n=1 Tax=Persicobacter psychrovividus TaxID=387638 RepID=A0ABM7VLT8_9BACT|nr:hypothetical protein PEPS_42390 [Persicobacter psychrovividus]
MRRLFTLLLLHIFFSSITFGQRNYTNSSPSVSEYFSWINYTNEGPSAAQTLANLSFFEWMNKSYGMQLDIYALDAGAKQPFSVVPWEYRVKPMDANYTFFFPMPAVYQGKTIEIFVLGMNEQHLEFTPTTHLLQYPHPYFSQQVTLEKIKL